MLLRPRLALSARCVPPGARPRRPRCSVSPVVANTARCGRRHRFSTARHDVQVACRSNGDVRLSILPTQQPSPILVFLPPGPLAPAAPLDQDDLLHRLQKASNATVVCIHYRLSPEHRYPTPIHDVLTAYDWVLDHLASQPQHRSARRPHAARIGVCGELIGGSLATALAMTECHMVSHRIVAAAVNNPIVDWIFPSDLRQAHEDAEADAVADDDEEWGRAVKNKLKKKPATQHQSWDAYAHSPALPSSTLTHARNVYFPNNDAYFDRFASPMHFFRSPGIGYVVPFKTEDDILSEVPDEYSVLDNIEHVLEVRRRAHRVYPPTGMGLKLPVVSLSVGQETVLLDQCAEFVRLFKRSVNKDWDSEEEGERRIGLRLRPGAGLWSGPFRAPGWHEEIDAIGAWFGRILR